MLSEGVMTLPLHERPQSALGAQDHATLGPIPHDPAQLCDFGREVDWGVLHNVKLTRTLPSLG
eukprot:6952333-Alexandrium_andersonii.AAC.1